jgi:hypothetical protein
MRFATASFLLLACSSTSGPPHDAAKILTASCVTPKIAPAATFDLAVRLTNAGNVSFDICIEQIGARVRSSDGSYVRPLAFRTTFDAPCPGRTHLPAGGEAQVTLPIFIWKDAPNAQLAVDAIVGVKWPPEMNNA